MKYTHMIQKPFQEISWEDDNFIEELLGVVQLFRPFSEAITEFISEHGYNGEITDVDAKVAFIRSAFTKANMDAPREIREWFLSNQPIKRDTAFQICFAFGLDGSETNAFFRRFYAHERSFNCHQVQEAIYYFCLNNGLSYADALDIQSQVPLAGKGTKGSEVVYTDSIIKELHGLDTREDLIAYLTENIDKFAVDNVTAYETIRQLWARATAPDGLLLSEQKLSLAIPDDILKGQEPIRTGKAGIRPWDAYLAILQLDKKSVKRLETDRSIKPIIEKLHADVQDSFPDRQGIDMILHGKHVSYERVRKWLVLLTFYTFWARKAIDTESYSADEADAERCFSYMNQMLIDAGYPELYVGNPYDWIFFYASRSDEPLTTFRYLWNELLTLALEDHP